MELASHKPKHEFFIAIDSDGCAFDTMELKHKECFIPNIIKHWELQAVSKYARQAAEFVNLYSKWRGINRFPALTMTLDLLEVRPEVKARGIRMPDMPNLRKWIKTESKLSEPTLEAYCAKHDDPDMHRALEWSRAINETVSDFVHEVPPFPCVRESLVEASARADLLVCSATPHDALAREWGEHNLASYVFAIAGQEQGSKSEHIAKSAGGKYPPHRMLMIGDAPGDLNAAKANNALFYPILPADEERSWQRFFDEGMARFFGEQFAGEYETGLIGEFTKLLPDTPPWM